MAIDTVRDRQQSGRFRLHSRFLDDYGAILGPYGIALYVALCRFADTDEQTRYPSHGTLATMTGMSRRQVIRKRKALRRVGLIEDRGKVVNNNE